MLMEEPSLLPSHLCHLFTCINKTDMRFFFLYTTCTKKPQNIQHTHDFSRWKQTVSDGYVLIYGVTIPPLQVHDVGSFYVRGLENSISRNKVSDKADPWTRRREGNTSPFQVLNLPLTNIRHMYYIKLAVATIWNSGVVLYKESLAGPGKGSIF